LPEKSKYMNDQAETALTIASALLQINAIKLNVKNPFIWVSGIKSPIYCDNRKTLSYPEIRNMIASSLVTLIRREFTECDMIAGVATGAIAHGMLVADRMDKPFIYVRSSAKGHGLANRIEGNITPGSAVVVVEDLVSTGKSSLEAVRALRAGWM
jgi:orotate phosphoribosyltransferase